MIVFSLRRGSTLTPEVCDEVGTDTTPRMSLSLILGTGKGFREWWLQNRRGTSALQELRPTFNLPQCPLAATTERYLCHRCFPLGNWTSSA